MLSKLIFREPKASKGPSATSLADLNSTFTWTRGADVQKVWRRYGWQPPSEYRDDYLFKINRETASQ